MSRIPLWKFWPVRSPGSLSAEVDLGVHRVQLLPSRERAEAVEDASSDWTVEASAGPRGYVTLGPVQFSLGLAMRVAIRPTQALDAGQVVLSNNRVGGEANLGFRVIL